MTRLTEALERAKRDQAEAPAAPERPQPVRDDVPADWQFTGTERTPAAPDPSSPARDIPPDWQFREPDLRLETTGRETVSAHMVIDEAPAAAEPASVDTAAADGAAADAPAPPAADTVARDKRSEKLIVGQHDNLLIEQFRRLAAVLHHAHLQRNARTVMIASAVPAEGKSLTSTNLALTLSRSYEKRVLLIDTDLRRPSLHALFSVPNTAGLTTSLNDPKQPHLPVVKVQENLWLLPAGRPDPNPTSLVTSPAMQQLLQDAVARFDWVILDTPPVGLMPDANLLAAMVDVAFVVVNAGHTPYPLVQKAVDAIGLERVLGVVLNRADRSAAAAAYSYGYYDYYTDESRKAAGGAKRLAIG
jgi:receptor protein-tyrosine kinase